MGSLYRPNNSEIIGSGIIGEAWSASQLLLLIAHTLRHTQGDLVRVSAHVFGDKNLDKCEDEKGLLERDLLLAISETYGPEHAVKRCIQCRYWMPATCYKFREVGSHACLACTR